MDEYYKKQYERWKHIADMRLMLIAFLVGILISINIP